MKKLVLSVFLFYLLSASALNDVLIRIVPSSNVIEQLLGVQNKVRQKLDKLDVDFVLFAPQSFNISIVDVLNVLPLDKNWSIREDQLTQVIIKALHKFHNLAVVNVLDIDVLDEFDLVKTENEHEYTVVLKVSAGGLLNFMRYELRVLLHDNGMDFKNVSYYEPSINLGSVTIANDYVAEEIRYVLMGVEVSDIKIKTDKIQLTYHDVNGMPLITDIQIA